MHNWIPIMGITLLDNSSLDDVAALFEDVEFDEAAVLGFRVSVVVEFFLVESVDVPDSSEPGVEETHVGVGESGLHAAADVVTADYDVLDVEVGDGCEVVRTIQT